ncbi:hypothetical protein BD779DRAFT_1567111 [Infundibulicybe gibba]|nr:hypothetical protein BD779DRAFT_1567111 [Infundibulicybe gibba]
MSQFTNSGFTFNGSSTFNQVGGNLHKGHVKHIHSQLVNSNNRNSTNVAGSNNIIGSHNTPSPRVHPNRGHYDAGRRQYNEPNQKPSYQRAERGRDGRSRGRRQSTPESSESEEEYLTAPESGSGSEESGPRRPCPKVEVQQPSRQAASGGPSSSHRRRGEAGTYAPPRSTSRPSDEGYGSTSD